MSWMRRTSIRVMNRMLTGYNSSSTLKKAMISAFMHNFPGQMTCVEFDSFMTDYLDGTLPDPERRKFDFHLEACPMCRTLLSDYKITVERARLSAADDLPAAPQELINAILAAQKNR